MFSSFHILFMSVLFWKGGGIMQPFYRYPTQPQHPMQPFQVNPHMQNMHGMNGMPRHPVPGSVDRFLGTIGSGGSITGGTNVFTMLNNVQKVLKVAETMGPMIKQYGPAMRNLPSIMTALKDFQNGSSSKADTEPEADTSKKAEKKEKKKEIKENKEMKENKEVPQNEKAAKSKNDGEEKKSRPKTSSKSPAQPTAKKTKKAPSASKPVLAAPRTNVPKGYHLSGPKLYV
jgi:hypothetical protein